MGIKRWAVNGGSREVAVKTVFFVNKNRIDLATLSGIQVDMFVFSR